MSLECFMALKLFVTSYLTAKLTTSFLLIIVVYFFKILMSYNRVILLKLFMFYANFRIDCLILHVTSTLSYPPFNFGDPHKNIMDCYVINNNKKKIVNVYCLFYYIFIIIITPCSRHR